MKKLSAFLPLLFACLTVDAQVLINEYSAANLTNTVDNFQQYGDWIELYNAGTAAADISGYYLSDDPALPLKWKMPNGVAINSKVTRLVWASGRDTAIKSGIIWHLHTNFKISQSKKNAETLILSDAAGKKIDEIKIGKMRVGQSRGRQANGGTPWVIFKKPTPRATNSGDFFTTNAEKPVFNKKPGFYGAQQSVVITTAEPNAKIYYTTNGFGPSAQSKLYVTPLLITQTTVLKAIVISNAPAVQSSLIEFATFFINEPRNNLRVMSVTGDSLLVLAEGNREMVGFGSFEYFDLTGERTASGYGEFNGHGQDSWVNDQRSIDIICRDECGYGNALTEKIFDLTERDEFQRIILRAAGDDNYPNGSGTPGGGAHMRDAYLQNLVKRGKMNVDVRTGEKAVIFLNGYYWGLYDLRERPDDHDYLEYNYGQDKFHLQYLKTWDRTWAEYGGNAAIRAWDDLHKYVKNHDLSVPANYDYVASQLDVTSLTDYVITNSLSVCSDWLNYNTGWWRGMDTKGKHRKWGYTLWDNDATFGYYINYTGIPDTSATALPCDVEILSDSLDIYNEPVIADDTLNINGIFYFPGDTLFPGGWFRGFSDLNGHMYILEQLRKNQEFNRYYITRYADLIHTVFSTKNMLDYFDEIYLQIKPEMPRHIRRWGGSVEEWEENAARLRNFIVRRTSAIRDSMRTCYQLTGPYSTTFRINPVGAGNIQINTQKIEQFPYTTYLYGGIGTKVSAAVNNPVQYKFNVWRTSQNSEIADSTATETSIFIKENETVTARFAKVVVAVNNLAKTAHKVELRVQPTLFTDKIVINYNVFSDENVQINLLSAAGTLVAGILNSQQNPGQYSLTTDLSDADLPAGLYLLDFKTGHYREVVKVVKR